MKISIIAYESGNLNVLESDPRFQNMPIQRLNLYFSNNLKTDDPNLKNMHMLDVRNFHDLTVNLIEFDPHKILYFPMEPHIIDGELTTQDLDLIYVEILEHILEVASFTNSTLSVVWLNLNNSSFMEDHDSMQVVQNMRDQSQKLISASNQSTMTLGDLDDPNFVNTILSSQ